MIRSFALAAAVALPLAAQDPTLTPLGTFRTGLFDRGAAEIVAHDPVSQRLFTVNGADQTVDILDCRNPSDIRRISQVRIPVEWGVSANSIVVRNGIVAVAVEASPQTDPGSVIFLDTEGRFRKGVKVGALPDMLTFTPDGRRVLTANEGQPSEDYRTDPEGSVSIIDISGGIDSLTQANVRTADFRAFTAANLPAGVRVFGPRATPAQDFEPEYIAIAPDSRTAWVTLQENNAIAILDIEQARFTRIAPLGVKEHWRAENTLDASDRDGVARLRTWTVFGMYQPDAIVPYTGPDGRLWLLTANEGDARSYQGFSEEVRVADLRLDPAMYPNAAEIQRPGELGRLRCTNAAGDLDGDGDIDMIHVYGARSFSVWTPDVRLAFDSGNQFELISQINLGPVFNLSNANNTFDDRSDDKGPEPEGIAVGAVRGVPYAFIANERQGNILIYDLVNPANPRYIGQWWNRNPFAPANTAAAGDLGPEGIIFIRAEDSPNGRPLLAVANEVSGTITLWQVN